MPSEISARKITLLLCSVEILGLAGIATFPGLLPMFLQKWQLSNTGAGWISAVYYAAYVLAVPLFTGLTDRIDARKILILAALTGAIANSGFALIADGFWSALFFRFLSGISLAGIYMPGLKLLSDFCEGPSQSRYVSFYTASFSIGMSFSFLAAGEIEAAAGWRWAFGAAAVESLAATMMVILLVPAKKIIAKRVSKGLIDFRPVLRNREAMAYVLGYAGHMWELFALRGWTVAFLAFSLQMQPQGAALLSPTQAAFLVALIGLPASVGGNEVARRFGRRRVVITVMLGSALVGGCVGFMASRAYLLVVLMTLVYGTLILGDSAALTAGTVAAAHTGQRGATLAVHSTIGFATAFLGPLAVGVVLDLFAQNRAAAWGAAFITMALGSGLGPLAFVAFGRRKGVKDAV